MTNRYQTTAGVASTANNMDAQTDSLRKELAYLQANILITEGKIDEAEELLSNLAQFSADPEKLDLLARISVLQGNYQKAKTIWETILQNDPKNELAFMALRRLASPWKTYAVLRRLVFLALLAVAAILCVVGVVTILNIPSSFSSKAPQIPSMVHRPYSTKSHAILPSTHLHVAHIDISGDELKPDLNKKGLLSKICG